MPLPRLKPKTPTQPVPALRSIQEVDECLKALVALLAVAVDRCEIAEFDRLSREVDRVLDIRNDLMRHERKVA